MEKIDLILDPAVIIFDSLEGEDILNSSFFSGLGIGLLLTGIVTVLLIPLIRKWMESSAFALPSGTNIKLPSKKELLRAIPLPTCLTIERKALWGNPAILELYGYTQEEFFGIESRLMFDSQEEYDRVGRDLYYSLEHNGFGEIETVHRKKDGTSFPCIVRIVNIPDPHGSGEAARLITVTDISMVKETMETLKEAGKIYHELFQNLPVGIFRGTREGQYLEANQYLAEMYGYEDPEEFINDITNAREQNFADTEEFDKIHEVLKDSNSMERFEVSLKNRYGVIFPASVMIRVVRTETGEPGYFEGIAIDESEKRAAQVKLEQFQYQLESMIAERTRELDYSLDELSNAKAQLIESERLASLGSLVGGITHEINTPVGVAYTAGTHMAGKVETIIRNFRENRLTKKDLETFLNTAEEAMSIINRNLDRAREFITDIKQVAVDQSSEKLRRFNLDEYLKIIVTSLKPVIKRSCAEVLIECEPEIIVDSYPGALSQVITNLVMNSIIHGFSGREEGIITIQGEKTNDNTVLISVKDNGVGIPEEIKDKIFDPYFTTKADSGGSGIGLHISASTVKDILKGSITVESEIEKGSVFTILFPSGTETLS